MNVLVTGSAGFIGKKIVERLREKPEINVVLGIDVVKDEDTLVCDIRDYDSLKKTVENLKPSIIIHTAAQAYIPKSFDDPVEDATKNIIGTLNVLRLALSYGSDLIFSSSAAVYGKPSTVPIPENHPTNPISPYGLSKLTCEKYIQMLYPQKSTIIRLSSVYGPQPGKRHGPVNRIIYDVLRNGVCHITGDGNQTRDFTHVSDVVSAIELIIDKGLTGTYNVGTGVEHSINDVVKILRNEFKISFKVEYLPKEEGEIERNVLNIEKIKLEGYKPKISLKEGIKDVLNFELNFLNKSLKE
ncbi:MAG: NAD-dependent epimerase/dehydratase family protein [Candidatus Bathyarchaeota archaeon]